MDKQAALARMQALCSQHETCIFDVRRKLATLDLTDDDRDDIVRRLLDDRFIDEARYATAFAADKFRFTGWGRIKIAQALRFKHIPSDAINDALEAIDDEAYIAALRRLLVSKRRTIKARSPWELTAKLMRFAVSRGFEPDIVRDNLPSDAAGDDFAD